MSVAVKTPPLKSVYFVTERPEDLSGLKIEDGAWIEIPTNVYAWPEGARRPEPVLCQSKDDPRHYKLFKYCDEIEGTEWEDTGLNFGGTFSAESWRRFAEHLSFFRALHAIPDEEGD